MKQIVILITLLSQMSFGQISNYLDNNVSPEEPKCADYIIIKPELNNENLKGQFEKEELDNISELLTNSFARFYKKVLVVSKDDFDKYAICNASVVIVKLQKYHKEPARMGQFEGVIEIQALTFKSINDTKPDRVQNFRAIGERHWGDSVPLQNAIKEVCKKIKKLYVPLGCPMRSKS